jgi:flagellar hook-basal body complex protein FliE
MIKNTASLYKPMMKDSLSFDKLQSDLKGIQDSVESSKTSPSSKEGFEHLLRQGLNDVNANLNESEKMSLELATGKHSNIHETMLAATRAELSFQLMVQMRNKAIEAYQDVMRMQV